MSRGRFWQGRGGKAAVGLVLVQIAVQALFVALLLLGESTRLGFMALYLPRHPMALGATLALGLALLARRRALAAVQGAVTVFVVVGVMGLHLHGEGAPPTVPVRLASYNVYFGKIDRPRLDQEIEDAFADVVVLQAAYDSLGDRLRKRFPDRVVHQEHELLLLSRLPLIEVEVPPIDAIEGEQRPMFVTYVLEARGRRFAVVNLHPFSPRHALFGEGDFAADVRVREAQVEMAMASARRRGLPFVVAGDTNLPEWSAIARRHFAGLTDAFADAGFGFGYTFPAKRPWMRIDRVLLGPDVRAVDARVAATGSPPASDHRMLFVVLDVAR